MRDAADHENVRHFTYFAAASRSQDWDAEDDATMATWNEVMELRIQELEQKVSGFGERFDTVDKRFDAVDSKFETLPTKTELKAFTEELSSQIKAAAEGYGANLDALRRDIKALSAQIATKDRDRDLVLKDHSRRLRALERLENRRRLQSKQTPD